MLRLHNLASYSCFSYQSIVQSTSRQLSSSGHYSGGFEDTGVNKRGGHGQARVISY